MISNSCYWRLNCGLYFLLTIYSCEGCTIDEEMKYKFNSSIKTVVDWELKNDTTIYTDDYLNSLKYLGDLTGNYPKVDYGGYTHHLSKEDFNSDIANWKRWYEENKCSYSR